MSVAYGTPGEEVRETGDGQQPSENGASLGSLVDVGETAEKESDDQTDVRATVLVDLGSPFRSHSADAQSLHGTGGTEGTGVGDGDDGQSDDRIENGGKDFDTSEFEGEDEWGVSGCTARGLGEIRVVRGDDQAKEEERKDVEQGDTPEHLFGGFGDGLAGVCSFSSGKTNQLSATEGEGGGDKDGAETLEAIAECAWLVPVTRSNITPGISWDATAVDDDTQDDEPGDGNDFDEAESKFNLSVAANTKNIDDGDQHQEDSDPNTDID